MAFEPKTWACGDTITAEELNRMEQGIAEAGQGGDVGYECTESEVTVFDGSVSVDVGGDTPPYMGEFTTETKLDFDEITVVFNGASYQLTKFESSGLPAYGDPFALSDYPFGLIGITDGRATLATSSKGNYNLEITATAETANISDCFKKAVKKATDENGSDVAIVTTNNDTSNMTPTEIIKAVSDGKLVFLLDGMGVFPLVGLSGDLSGQTAVFAGISGDFRTNSMVIAQYTVHQDSGIIRVYKSVSFDN